MPDSSEASYLFVYGTLRRDAAHPMAEVLHAASTHLGEARFQGRLYRVSWYPAAVASPDPEETIIGDLFALHAGREAELLETLDEYEGTKSESGRPPYYRRERHAVTLSDGRTPEAWVYLFNRSTDKLERIASGDFVRRWKGRLGFGFFRRCFFKFRFRALKRFAGIERLDVADHGVQAEGFDAFAGAGPPGHRESTGITRRPHARLKFYEG
jgi:gamma-glutamylcyclotransferase (GGCT)/AIG2-like uncharacterized protein YtfP